uniref:Zgc:123010 n=1 Tax=Haplochromis burtoni TaxID=8153 RepID=A0A3Q3D128_HAPBU
KVMCAIKKQNKDKCILRCVLEELSDEEKARRKAERRKAKRKVRGKAYLAGNLYDDEEDGGAESELDESDSEAEVGGEDEKQRAQQEEEGKLEACSKDLATPAIAPSGYQETQARSAEEEPEWDVSSAFFANAASHIKPKGSSRKSKENKENEARREPLGMFKNKSLCPAEKGIKLVQEGQYAQAASMFTEAIKCDPKDYRFFGNRSYCYYCLEQYPQALADAERSIQLAPDWPKGYFRKGSALMGMKRYSEAEKAMEQVLKLDKDCEEAVNNLFNCKVLQLMVTPTHKSSVDVTRIICMPSPNDSCDPRKCFFLFSFKFLFSTIRGILAQTFTR